LQEERDRQVEYLERLGGAKEGENIHAVVTRLVAERDRMRDALQDIIIECDLTDPRDETIRRAICRYANGALNGVDAVPTCAELEANARSLEKALALAFGALLRACAILRED